MRLFAVLLFSFVWFPLTVSAQVQLTDQPQMPEFSADEVMQTTKLFYQQKAQNALHDMKTYRDRYSAVSFWTYPRTFWEDTIPSIPMYQKPGSLFSLGMADTWAQLNGKKIDTRGAAEEVVRQIVLHPRRVNVAKEIPFPEVKTTQNLESDPWWRSFYLASFYVQINDYAAKVDELRSFYAEYKKHKAAGDTFMLQNHPGENYTFLEDFPVTKQAFLQRKSEIESFIRAYTYQADGFVRRVLAPAQTDRVPGANIRKYLEKNIRSTDLPKGISRTALIQVIMEAVSDNPQTYYDLAEKMNPGMKTIAQSARNIQPLGTRATGADYLNLLSLFDYISVSVLTQRLSEFGKIPSHAEVISSMAEMLAANDLNKSLAQVANDLFEFEKPFYYAYHSFANSELEIGKNWHAIATNEHFKEYPIGQIATENILQSGRRQFQDDSLILTMKQRRMNANAQSFAKTAPLMLDFVIQADVLVFGLGARLINVASRSKAFVRWGLKGIKMQKTARNTLSTARSASKGKAALTGLSSNAKVRIPRAPRVEVVVPPPTISRPAAVVTSKADNGLDALAGVTHTEPLSSPVSAGRTPGQLGSEMFDGAFASSNQLGRKAARQARKLARKIKNAGVDYWQGLAQSGKGGNANLKLCFICPDRTVWDTVGSTNKLRRAQASAADMTDGVREIIDFGVYRLPADDFSSPMARDFEVEARNRAAARMRKMSDSVRDQADMQRGLVGLSGNRTADRNAARASLDATFAKFDNTMAQLRDNLQYTAGGAETHNLSSASRRAAAQSDEAFAQAEKLRKEVETLQPEFTRQKGIYDEGVRRSSQLESNNYRLQQDQRRLQREVSNLQDDLEKARRRAERSPSQGASERVQELQTQLNQKQAQLNVIEQQYAANTAEITRLKNQTDEAYRQMAALEDQIASKRASQLDYLADALDHQADAQNAAASARIKPDLPNGALSARHEQALARSSDMLYNANQNIRGIKEQIATIGDANFAEDFRRLNKEYLSLMDFEDDVKNARLWAQRIQSRSVNLEKTLSKTENFLQQEVAPLLQDISANITGARAKVPEVRTEINKQVRSFLEDYKEFIEEAQYVGNRFNNKINSFNLRISRGDIPEMQRKGVESFVSMMDNKNGAIQSSMLEWEKTRNNVLYHLQELDRQLDVVVKTAG